MESVTEVSAAPWTNCYLFLRTSTEVALAVAWTWGKLAGTKAVEYYVILAQSLVLWLDDNVGFNTLALLGPIVVTVLAMNMVWAVKQLRKSGRRPKRGMTRDQAVMSGFQKRQG
ncbi:hypothetical protein AYL99_05189 [Fonsecaea erecta]|uniref:Uncharacterized protein n=1 Tax=Fonsecaea erecta TaxID=1367422 RepID=A0A178ZK68_9EURO|nr:hypothetical protein AYL99_05189 [Fonsecaea erecta]OAP60187.1 hypothetical protein AYL99_05189 [Fonsecaea erecta]